MPATPPRPLAPDLAEAPAFDRREAFDLIEQIATTEGLPMEWMLSYRDPYRDQQMWDLTRDRNT